MLNIKVKGKSLPISHVDLYSSCQVSSPSKHYFVVTMFPDFDQYEPKMFDLNEFQLQIELQM